MRYLTESDAQRKAWSPGAWGFLAACCSLAGFLALSWPAPAQAIRLKDVASFKGVRANQLLGNGLVVGLNGTGDGTNVDFNAQELANMLANMGVTVSRGKMKVKNIAAVAVTAVLPPFARVGSRIDVLVSSMGDAKSLQGGTLVLTPLKGVDGQVYALAQGPISVGGFAASGEAGGGVTKNHPTAGRIANGASVEREIPFDFAHKGDIIMALNDQDFTTANRAVGVINKHLRGSYASSQDSGTISIKIPPAYKDKMVSMLASLENLEIATDTVAKVIIDERNGTVVMGENVRLSTVAIAHGNLMIQIKEKPRISQPLPFSRGGTTAVVPDTSITVKEGADRLMVMPEGVNIGQVVQALNAIGVTPRDLIAILQAIKAAGALQAELQII
ncbi:MAG: flagellar basal body P-ring protein FlgI [Deltaproteobacteria bacterium]|nr:flagellar basal body P-ring protein FlgI [Deltaproteobacteria bacterium]MBI4796871.1 flagellar basal body P-ring protein FlgI [Deltaproteobacteria bacterium]